MDLQQLARTLLGNVQRDTRQLQQDPQAFQQQNMQMLNRIGPLAVAGMSSPVKAAQSITKTLPINRLAFNQDDFARAMGDVLEGSPQKTGQTAMDILATKGEGGAYHVKDGLHRLAKAILAGDNKIPAIIDEAAYRKLNDLQSPRYIRGALGRFQGSKMR